AVPRGARASHRHRAGTDLLRHRALSELHPAERGSAARRRHSQGDRGPRRSRARASARVNLDPSRTAGLETEPIVSREPAANSAAALLKARRKPSPFPVADADPLQCPDVERAQAKGQGTWLKSWRESGESSKTSSGEIPANASSIKQLRRSRKRLPPCCASIRDTPSTRSSSASASRNARSFFASRGRTTAAKCISTAVSGSDSTAPSGRTKAGCASTRPLI